MEEWVIVVVQELQLLLAHFNSCSTPSSPFSNNFELLDNTGTSIFTRGSTLSDSVVLPTLIAGDYILTSYKY